MYHYDVTLHCTVRYHKQPRRDRSYQRQAWLPLPPAPKQLLRVGVFCFSVRVVCQDVSAGQVEVWLETGPSSTGAAFLKYCQRLEAAGFTLIEPVQPAPDDDE